MSLPISESSFGALCQQIEKRLHKIAYFYIGRTCNMTRRREAHERRERLPPPINMVKVATYRTAHICEAVEEGLIRHFKGRLLRCRNEAEDGRGGTGKIGPYHVYLMWHGK